MLCALFLLVLDRQTLNDCQLHPQSESVTQATLINDTHTYAYYDLMHGGLSADTLLKS